MSLKYVLLGYMGSGKSTVGQQLAAAMSFSHVDLDDFIELEESSTIASIIEEKGIIYFRKIEKKHLETLLGRTDSFVLSLGGGTPCYYDNMKKVADDASIISFYLRANVPFLTQRLFNEREHRPLISRFDTVTELAEFIGKHLLERSLFYDQATHTIDIQNKSVQELVDEIKKLG